MIGLQYIVSPQHPNDPVEAARMLRGELLHCSDISFRGFLHREMLDSRCNGGKGDAPNLMRKRYLHAGVTARGKELPLVVVPAAPPWPRRMNQRFLYFRRLLMTQTSANAAASTPAAAAAVFQRVPSFFG